MGAVTVLVLVRMWYAFFTIGAALWGLIVALSYLPDLEAKGH